MIMTPQKQTALAINETKYGLKAEKLFTGIYL